MRAPLMSQIALPYLALVAACGAALAFGFTYIQRELPARTGAVTALPQASSPALSSASSDRVEASAALPAAQAEANALAAELTVSRSPSDTDGSMPAFDVARIGRAGDAVIAGRAAPGATVELLRNDERLDEAVADKSGQFVMVPSRLPPGDYELTLRSRLPDGTLATSKQGVRVALAEAEPPQSRPETPLDGPPTTATSPSSQNQAVRSSQARLLPQPSLRIAKPRYVAVSQLSSPRATGRQLDGGSSASRGIATSVVSSGDSLWRISRLTYGVGTLYALVYKANRNRIRDPNRIYPGQVFVLPKKTQ
jgi:nucleoid-associated protein YgaU